LFAFLFVLEKNPPKQGLKRKQQRGVARVVHCFREKSTKTRIETSLVSSRAIHFNIVLEKNPPKQGLKRLTRGFISGSFWCFREKSTKTRIETLRRRIIIRAGQPGFREKSTKTRIETPLPILVKPFSQSF